MIKHSAITDKTLFRLLLAKKIRFAGNAKLKIYGSLHCSTGKRMNRENRVFFASEKQALQKRYRPCGHCMRDNYKQWKENSR